LRPSAKPALPGAGYQNRDSFQTFGSEAESIVFTMKKSNVPIRWLFAAMLLLTATAAWATFNYDYGADEYVTVSNGISPNRKLAITTHGEDEGGYQNFHVYLFDAEAGRKIGPLEEIVDTLDTGAGAFAAKWSKDSTQVTIIYRVDRHAPLKSMTYRLANGRAIPATKKPVDVADGELLQFWSDGCSESKPPKRTFGTPRRE
jgi:hypothetical protein